jgi:hypothetical protein
VNRRVNQKGKSNSRRFGVFVLVFDWLFRLRRTAERSQVAASRPTARPASRPTTAAAARD